MIWSTRRRWKLDESAAEFVHTVLTRATSLVIIVFDPMGTDADIIESLRNLRRDRLLFWTAEAESSWIQCVGPNLGTDEKRTALARGNPLAASRTYACSTSMLLCCDTSRILKTEAPRRAALVRKPARSEWAPKSAGLSPSPAA